MENLTSVTELLILAGLGWVVLQALSEQPTSQEELIPIPVEDKKRSLDR